MQVYVYRLMNDHYKLALTGLQDQRGPDYYFEMWG